MEDKECCTANSNKMQILTEWSANLWAMLCAIHWYLKAQVVAMLPGWISLAIDIDR